MVTLSLYVAMFVEFKRISFLQKVFSVHAREKKFPYVCIVSLQVSNEKKHACSGLFGDWTTQLCVDYKPR